MHMDSLSAAEELTCAICLQAYEALDKAVISSCLHAFCLGCLQAWCRNSVTRLCPLCKRHITGYLFNIHSDDDYSEHVFDDSALQQVDQQSFSSLHGLAINSSRNSNSSETVHIRAEESSRYSPYRSGPHAGSASSSSHQHELLVIRDRHLQQQRERVELRSEAGYSWGDPHEWQAAVLQRRPLHNGGSNSRLHGYRWQRQQQQQQHHPASTGRGGSSSSREGRAADGVEPRPYYWRVQQRMLASVVRRGPDCSRSNAAEADSALQRRMHIYSHNLWALPHPNALAAAANNNGGSSSRCRLAALPNSSFQSHGGGAVPGSAATGVRVSEASLESWMQRELQALLLEDDVAILCAFVKGLVNSFGVSVTSHLTDQQQQQQQGAAVRRAAIGSMQQAGQLAAARFSYGAHAPQADLTSTDEADAIANRSPPSITHAAAALEGFLFEAAAHFWHELCCYATSGLTVTAWDRVARYILEEQLQQHIGQESACLLSGGSSSDSMWQLAQLQGQTQARTQQQQQQGVSAQHAGSSSDSGSTSPAADGTHQHRKRQRASRWDVPAATVLCLEHFSTRQQRSPQQQQQQQGAQSVQPDIGVLQAGQQQQQAVSRPDMQQVMVQTQVQPVHNQQQPLHQKQHENHHHGAQPETQPKARRKLCNEQQQQQLAVCGQQQQPGASVQQPAIPGEQSPQQVQDDNLNAAAVNAATSPAAPDNQQDAKWLGDSKYSSPDRPMCAAAPSFSDNSFQAMHKQLLQSSRLGQGDREHKNVGITGRHCKFPNSTNSSKHTILVGSRSRRHSSTCSAALRGLYGASAYQALHQQWPQVVPEDRWQME